MRTEGAERGPQTRPNAGELLGPTLEGDYCTQRVTDFGLSYTLFWLEIGERERCVDLGLGRTSNAFPATEETVLVEPQSFSQGQASQGERVGSATGEVEQRAAVGRAVHDPEVHVDSDAEAHPCRAIRTA